ncbi:transmembrane protease serine 9-like [Antedon mediterranea]|uniref:transmembrane protease serine 9-like n=1 Tax=Antedon mediterranea TaxID=105859 RepID=UPI003AF8C2F1
MARIQEESAILTVQSKGNIHHECGIVTSPEALQEQKNRGKNRIRLLNGRDAARGSAPWMVRLYYIPNQKDICGGSILNSEWIVTAAHCVNLKEKHKNSTLIRVADHDSEFEEFEEKNYTIGKIVRHPDFNQSTWDSDIAMIKLETPISQFTDYVRPICLPTKNIIKPGKLGRVNGWGITSTSNITHPRFMNEIYVPVVSQRKCISSTNATFAITRNMFCAGYAQETTDACYGDSGGPFSVFHEGRWYLSGIVSWGEGCGEPGKYGFYTRISAFRKWIKNVMRKEYSCAGNNVIEFLSLTVLSSSAQDLPWTLEADTGILNQTLHSYEFKYYYLMLSFIIIISKYMKLFVIYIECGSVTSPEAMLDQGNRRGREASRGSAPWMVRLYQVSQDRYFCGGSIVNSKWIITAAHCITEFNVNKMNTLVHVADHDSEYIESEEMLYRIKKIVTHADFNDDTYDADIAIIKLDTPISNFTHYVRPICLPTNNLTERIMKPRKHGRVSGWGDIRENGPRPRFMNEVYLPIVGQRKCISSTTYNVTDNMFCAGYKQKLKDACQGDSGGPFSILHEDRWYLFGIVSWGEGCGRPGKYGFYTRISAFLDWITNVILGETPCPPLETSANVEADCNRLGKPGQVCNFRCSGGHVRTTGDVRRVCQLDGTWSGNELSLSVIISRTITHENIYNNLYHYYLLEIIKELLISKPIDVTRNTGDTLVFRCTLEDDLYSIVWEKDGDVIISNEHTHIFPDGTLLINGITSNDAGKYTCTVMARVQEESAILTVQTKGNIHHGCGIVTSPEALLEQKNRGKNRIRLLNGRDAARGSAPWMVRLYYISSKLDICGGSILNSEWIVTAAHCVRSYKVNSNSTLIRVADHDSEFEESEEKNYTIDKIVRHPDFRTWDSDIALIKLETPISNFSDYVKPICLPTNNLPTGIMKPGKLGRVNGWGITSNITLARFMNEIYVPVVSQRKCISSTNLTAITRNMFCAGYAQETTDACYGDSGGPFSILYKKRWYLSGIVSWGEGCGQPGKYGVYTRISTLLKWIKNVMRKQ